MGTILDSSVKQGSRRGRLNYDAEFKRKLAAASCEAGVSVARLALEHGINANMLHKWRRHYRAAVEDKTVSTQFLPVMIAQVSSPISNQPVHLQQPQPAKPSLPNQPRRADGTLEIKFAGATVRIKEVVEASVLEAVLRHFHP